MKLTEKQIRSVIRESLINSNDKPGPNLLNEGLSGALKFIFTGIKNRYRSRGADVTRLSSGGRGLGGGKRAGALESAAAYTAAGLLSYDVLDRLFQIPTGETLSSWLFQWTGDNKTEYYIKACCSRVYANDVDAIFANESTAETFFREEFSIPESTPVSLTIGGFSTLQGTSEPVVVNNWRRTILKIGAGTTWVARFPVIGADVPDFNDEEIDTLEQLVIGLERAVDDGTVSLYDLSYKSGEDGLSIADTIISGVNLWGTGGLEFLDPDRYRVKELVDRWVIALQDMPDFVMSYYNSATGKRESFTVFSPGERPAVAGIGTTAAEILSSASIVEDITSTAESQVASEQATEGGDETTSATGSPGTIVEYGDAWDQFQDEGNSAAEKRRQLDDVKAVVGSSAATYSYALATDVQEYITSKNHSDINAQDKVRLREAALDAWQFSTGQAGAVAAGKILYLLDRMGYDRVGGLYSGAPRDGYIWILGQMR